MKTTLAGLVLASALLAGCASSQPAASVTKVPASAPTSAPAATSAPPTVAAPPTAVPTNTVAAPTPTTVPPTAAPTTAAPSPTSGSLASTDTICDNPYYPVKPGATWVYQNTHTGTAPGTTTTTETVSDITPTSFVRDYTTGAKTSQIHWTCSASGLTSGDFNPDPASTGASSLTFQVLQASGTTIPPADQWKVGTTWQDSYNVTMHMAPSGSKAVPAVSGTGTITVTYKILAKSDVTVPAGTYSGWQVSDTLNENLAMTMNGKAMPINAIKVPGTLWMVPNVGMVKNEVKVSGMDSTTELVSYKP